MKIAFLNIYNGIVERGAEIFVSELANRLSDRYKIDVFQTGGNKGKGYSTVQISGIPRSSFLYTVWVGLFTIRCLPYLWNNKYDFIIPVNGRLQVLICRLFRHFRGGKILITGHSGMGFDDRLNIILGKPDVFVALTPPAYEWAKEINRSADVRYIPNGVDTEKFNPQIREERISLKKPVVLCVAALVPYKNVELLIRAVSKTDNWSLLVIGDGPLRSQIERMGNQILGDRFQLIRHVPHEVLPRYYRAADLFSLPSGSSEAFGLVYLEALACNTPVLAPDDDNRRKLVADGGLFFKPGDTDDYAVKIKQAAKTDFADKPRKQAEQYSWTIITNNYYKLLVEFSA